MFSLKLKAAALALLGGAVLAASARLPASAEETKSSDQTAIRALSADGFARFHRMLLPQDGELQWMAVPWRTSITLARHQSAVENKPLLIFADTGAGFADALGLC
jgi:hypothetical protein